jgi:hypothetical protein
MAQTTTSTEALKIKSIEKETLLWPLVSTLLLAIAYFAYSFKSKGFYQQDEANHFLSMLRFWYDPKAIMGNWAKPGYKILYVLTVLGGQKLVVFQNCLFAAFSCFFAYLSSQKLGASNPWIAFILLASQPLWIALSFRNYSEFPTAFLLSMGFYFFVSEKWILAAILAGWVCTIRQEFYPIAAILGLYLLYRKAWFAAFSIALFPVLQNLAGYVLYGDPLYLLNQILGTSETLKDAYKRMGFDHYFLTSAVVFGPLALTLFVAYLGQMFLTKKLAHPALLVATLGYFLLNCLFQMESLEFGPATGGNLRYMCIISPLVAVAGALAVDAMKNLPGRFKLAYTLLPFLVLVGVFMTFQHNFLTLTEESDNLPFVGALFASILIFIPMSGLVQTGVFAAVCGFFALVNVKSIKLSAEDKVCKQVADWYKMNEVEFKGKPFYNTHIMFYYFLGRVEAQFDPKPVPISDTATLEKAPIGSIVLWENHYGFRPNYKTGLPYEFFANSGKYRQREVFQAEEGGFAYVIFEKEKM